LWFINAGLLSCVVGTLLVGPMPISNVEPALKQLWVACIGQSAISAGVAAFWVPSLPLITMAVFWHGRKHLNLRIDHKDLAAVGWITGMSDMAENIGRILGPTLAGFLLHHTSSQWTYTALGLIQFGYWILFSVTWLFQPPQKLPPLNTETTSEKMGLLSDQNVSL